MSKPPASEFEQIVDSRVKDTVLTDFWYFITASKKWWLVPVLGILLVFSAIMLLSGTAAAPFIYTLF